MSATQLAKAMGATVIALDISPERLARAKEFGADAIVNPGSNDPIGAIKDLTHGRYAELTLDTSSASGSAHRTAIRSCKVWGTCCFVGEGGDVQIDVSPRHAAQAADGDRRPGRSPTIGQAECARFVVERRIDVDALFTHRWKLDQADEAYKLFDTQTTGKACS